MKYRNSFVTNSSSSSFIICFARIVNEKKAQEIIEKEDIDVFSADEIKSEMRYGCLGADWAGAEIYGVDRLLEAYPNDKYIIIKDSEDGYEDEDGEVEYSYDFSKKNTIAQITNENGFSDIDIAEGEGRNG